MLSKKDQALKILCIEHWKKMLEYALTKDPDGEYSGDEMKNDIGVKAVGSDCPFCVAYGQCAGCPIFEKTSERFCQATPCHRKCNMDVWNDFCVMAKEEIEFLESL